ncbi:MAG: hypothetical protein ACRDXB_02325 [Actinomycetes bacterium]
MTGASRTGKTTWVVKRVRRARRLLVWDSAGEFSDLHNCIRVTDVRELAELVKPGAPARRIAFCVPVTAKNFEAFCRLAWVFICSHRDAVLVVEELADVTTPNKAPAAWGELIRKGLRYGPEIYALTQRPAESDKTSIGNASVLVVHQCALEIDATYMAKQLRVPVELVDALKPYERIERDRRSKSLTTYPPNLSKRAA